MDRICVLLIWSVVGMKAADEPILEKPKPFEVSVQGSFSYGFVDGFMQVPAGGTPGSSTPNRPTFHELKIDDGGFYDTRMNLRWRQLEFFGGYQAMDFDSSGTLSRTLVSRSKTFPSGTHFKTEDDFDWFRVGVGWNFELLDRRLEIMPKADLAVLNFSYKLSGGGESVSRSYAKPAARLGLEGRYHLTSRVSFEVDGTASIPVSNMPQIATATATVNFSLLPRPRRVNPSIFVGGGFERIDYEDNQPLPNHTRVDMGPFATVGLRISL